MMTKDTTNNPHPLGQGKDLEAQELQEFVKVTTITSLVRLILVRQWTKIIYVDLMINERDGTSIKEWHLIYR